ncbi:hypothetical protein NM688_g3746 [Phlebia brevispora]|uniref:Uncharacterized protein n=1 Tax=Phlebia brevispora TaxID=194682 RepID=A0ACC1T535_9APHY|nr:hypothetical protein NM688_g3746 [Phlebia brevispora]
MEYSPVYPPPPKKITFEEMKAMADNGLIASQDGLQWHIGLKSVSILLQTAEKSPEVLRNCQALWIESPDEGDYDEEFMENPDVFATKCEALSRLLDITASHGRLQRFDWTWMSGVMDDGQPEVPPKVWTSLAKNGSTLRSLNITVTQQDYGESLEASWGAFSLEGFSALRHLNLGLERAHGWPGSKLHKMLKALPGLTSLHFRCPLCCGIEEFALASHHPNLRSLTLHSTTYPNQVSVDDPKSEDFIKRHPLIEYLDLTYLQDVDEKDGELKLDSEDLQNLRAINIGLGSQLLDMQLASRPIEAVQFFDFPSLEVLSKLPADRIKYVSINLHKPAELQHKTEKLTTLLSKLPALTELQLHVPASGYEQADLDKIREYEARMGAMDNDDDSDPMDEDFDLADIHEEDAGPMDDPEEDDDSMDDHDDDMTFDPMDQKYMIPFLQALSSSDCANSLIALSFVDILGNNQLTPAVLDDFPCSLPKLRYLGWETKDDNKKLYELRRMNGKVSATLIEPLRQPTARRLFVDESILDHFGEEAREW